MPKHLSRWLIAGMVVALAFAMTGCGKAADTNTESTPAEQPAAEPTTPAEEPAPQEAVTEVPKSPGKTAPVTELKTEDVVVGTGAEAKSGSNVTVHYTLWDSDGKMIESSIQSGQPFTFQIDAGQVIPGWDQGVAGMKVGGTRNLVIPPALAYGDAGSPPAIPGGATLVFQVKLLDVQ